MAVASRCTAFLPSDPRLGRVSVWWPVCDTLFLELKWTGNERYSFILSPTFPAVNDLKKKELSFLANKANII